MHLFKFTDEFMGSEVHFSLKHICEATNSAMLPCMVKSYEQLSLPLVPVTSNYVSKPREITAASFFWRIVPFKENVIFDVHLITFLALLSFRFQLNPSEVVHP